VTTLKTEASIKPWRIGEWFPEIDSKTNTLLKNFDTMILNKGQSLSLFSHKTMMFSDAIHFADCILAGHIIFSANANINHIYDFSGTGLPAVVFAAMNHKVKVTCVEPVKHKYDFFKSAATELGISNLEVVHAGLDSLGADTVNFGVYRGPLNLSKTILSARKAFCKGASFFHFKSDQWGVEISQIPTQLCSVWSPSLVQEYRLPIGDFKLAIVKTEKI
jgi:16S rRNA (guanine527-N7)-methyltransferase